MIYDISPQLNEQASTWPGDEHMHRRQTSFIRSGEPCNLNTLRAPSHLGAHAIAPCFLTIQGQSIDQVKLDPFIGHCQLIRVKSDKNQALYPKDLQGVKIQSKRLLIDTGTFNAERVLTVDFAHLSSELIEYLYDQGVRTIGIDSPSIDSFNAKNWSSHRACIEKEIDVLAGLLLWKVPLDQYELIALPLKLQGFDASPVRAILRTLPN